MINWKTTAGGILVLLATTAQTIAALVSAGTPINWGQMGIQTAIGIALIFAKDFNVTGIGVTATTDVGKAADLNLEAMAARPGDNQKLIKDTIAAVKETGDRSPV